MWQHPQHSQLSKNTCDRARTHLGKLDRHHRSAHKIIAAKHFDMVCVFPLVVKRVADDDASLLSDDGLSPPSLMSFLLRHAIPFFLLFRSE